MDFINRIIFYNSFFNIQGENNYCYIIENDEAIYEIRKKDLKIVYKNFKKLNIILTIFNNKKIIEYKNMNKTIEKGLINKITKYKNTNNHLNYSNFYNDKMCEIYIYGSKQITIYNLYINKFIYKYYKKIYIYIYININNYKLLL